MMKAFRIATLRFRSDNQKSKTCTEPFDSDQDKLRRSSDDLKWLGLPVIAFVPAMCAAVAHAQQSAKIPKVGFLDLAPVPDRGTNRSNESSGNLVMSMART
jgi:hypothetical protein